MLKYDNFKIPTTELNCSITTTMAASSNKKTEYCFTVPSENSTKELFQHYSLKESGLFANTIDKRVRSANPITELVAISSIDDKKIENRIIDFTRIYGLINTPSTNSASFSAEIFCLYSKRLRTLLDILECSSLLNLNKPETFINLLQYCIQIQYLGRPDINIKLDEDDDYGGDYDYGAEKRKMCKYIGIDLDFRECNNEEEKYSETGNRLQLLQELQTYSYDKYMPNGSPLLKLKSYVLGINDGCPIIAYLTDMGNDTLKILLKIYQECSFYVEEDGRLHFKDTVDLKKTLNKSISDENNKNNEITIAKSIKDLSNKIITDEFEYFVPQITYQYDAENNNAIISDGTFSLIQLMYFSLMVLNHNKYRYTNCANPNCKKKVLRLFPGNNGGYCCYACRKRHNAAEKRAAKRRGGEAIEQSVAQ